MTSMAPPCAAQVHDAFGVGFHRCLNAATGEDGLCGVHRNAARKATERRTAQDQRMRDSDEREAEARLAAEQLAAAGVPSRLQYVDGYTGGLIIERPDVDRLLELVRLGHAEAVAQLADRRQLQAEGEPVGGPLERFVKVRLGVTQDGYPVSFGTEVDRLIQAGAHVLPPEEPDVILLLVPEAVYAAGAGQVTA